MIIAYSFIVHILLSHLFHLNNPFLDLPHGAVFLKQIR